MRYKVYILAFSTLILMNSCKKSASGINKPDSISLTGRWNYTGSYYSIGGPSVWTPVKPFIKQWIDIKADGSFSSNFSPFNAASRYQLTDSVHIKFTGLPAGDSLYYYYRLDQVNRELFLSPGVNICIEGCAQKFTR